MGNLKAGDEVEIVHDGYMIPSDDSLAEKLKATKYIRDYGMEVNLNGARGVITGRGKSKFNGVLYLVDLGKHEILIPRTGFKKLVTLKNPKRTWLGAYVRR